MKHILVSSFDENSPTDCETDGSIHFVDPFCYKEFRRALLHVIS